MGPTTNNNRLEAMEEDLNLIYNRVERMKTNLTYLLQQLMQRMEWLETRSNFSNKGEAVEEQVEPPHYRME